MGTIIAVTVSCNNSFVQCPINNNDAFSINSNQTKVTIKNIGLSNKIDVRAFDCIIPSLKAACSGVMSPPPYKCNFTLKAGSKSTNVIISELYGNDITEVNSENFIGEAVKLGCLSPLTSPSLNAIDKSTGILEVSYTLLGLTALVILAELQGFE